VSVLVVVAAVAVAAAAFVLLDHYLDVVRNSVCFNSMERYSNMVPCSW
jgi:hypothetical protein